MKNKIEDLRNHLFETLEKLKDGDMEVETAKAVSGVAQTIINSAKVEIDYLRLTEQRSGTGFIPDECGRKSELPPPARSLKP